jgi:hypothetical protein
VLYDVVACLGYGSSDVMKIRLVELHGFAQACEHLPYQHGILRAAEKL